MKRIEEIVNEERRTFCRHKDCAEEISFFVSFFLFLFVRWIPKQVIEPSASVGRAAAIFHCSSAVLRATASTNGGGRKENVV